MTTAAAHIARGRQLVESGTYAPAGMLDSMAVLDYWHSQRQLVARRGQCAARCGCALVEAANGENVCPHTWQACRARSIAKIVSIWENIGCCG